MISTPANSEKKSPITDTDIKIWKEQIEKTCPFTTYDGEATFAWVLHQYLFCEDAAGKQTGIMKISWEKDTVDSYVALCCEKLIPALPENTPIFALTADHFDAALAHIQGAYSYSDSTMETYALHIWRICDAGFRNGYCPDILWGTHYYRGKQPEMIAEKQGEYIRKSLSRNIEREILDRLLKNPETAQGQEVGLAIMALTAMRNNEVCGLNIGDLRNLQATPTTDTLWIYKTTKLSVNKVKAGGKTRNANRVLPLLNPLSAFLKKRNAFLQSKIDDGTLPAGTDLSQLPLVCFRDQYTRRCKSGDLSTAGRLLFKAVQLDQEHIAVLEQYCKTTKNLEEKDATTYLFRRNFGTHIRNLGFSMSQIQYYMGHDVEDHFETRNGFSNEQKLQEMKEILDFHPLFHSTTNSISFTTVDGGMAITNTNDIYHEYTLIAPQDNTTYYIQVQAKTAQDEISLKLEADTPFDVRAMQAPF